MSMDSSSRRLPLSSWKLPRAKALESDASCLCVFVCLWIGVFFLLATSSSLLCELNDGLRLQRKHLLL